MKLTAIYSVFNGCELLEGAIDQIINSVDHVVLIYQEVSNSGELNDRSKFLCDKLTDGNNKIIAVPFIPDLNKPRVDNETDKYNLGLLIARELQSTHFLIGAEDHYYTPEQFMLSKLYCHANDVDVSTTKMFTYIGKPSVRLNPLEDYEMLFICKLNHYTRFGRGKLPVKTDPVMQIQCTGKFHSFDISDCILHHYSWVREDFKSKLYNSTAYPNYAKSCENMLREVVEIQMGEANSFSYYPHYKLQKTKNLFKSLEKFEI